MRPKRTCEGPGPTEIPLLNGDPSLTVGSSHVCTVRVPEASEGQRKSVGAEQWDPRLGRDRMRGAEEGREALGRLNGSQASRTEPILEGTGQAMALAQSNGSVARESHCITHTSERMWVPTCQTLGNLWVPPTSRPTQL